MLSEAGPACTVPKKQAAASDSLKVQDGAVLAAIRILITLHFSISNPPHKGLVFDKGAIGAVGFRFGNTVFRGLRNSCGLWVNALKICVILIFGMSLC